jgi:repressor LexA
MRQAGHNDTRERIFNFLHEFFDERGYAPTVRDILKGCDISSTAVVQHHLDVLEREGRIHRDPEVFRSIRLTEKRNITGVPLLGVIAAGKPIPVPSPDTWTNQTLDTIELPQEMTGNRQVYALRVKGQSMIDALIDDGDIVLMEPASTARNGEMVAAWLKDERSVTLKRFYMEPDKVILKPANRTMKPITIRPENIEIQGKVVGVIRRLD